MSWYRGFENLVRERVPLACLTNYRVGGPAEFFAEPRDISALGHLLARAWNEKIPVRLLGRGTNLLVSDSGVAGLVLKLNKSGFGFLRRDGFEIHVGAGHSLPALVKWSVAQGLGGLECLNGVPGTVGAALRMNAGGTDGEICTRVRRVRGFERDGTPFVFSHDDCGFVYRNSGLSGRIVTDCDLELIEADPVRSKKQMDDILQKKCATQPVYARSAGCVFKNPRIQGVPPAGRLIDEVGLKGFHVNGASVSTLHANFLICEQDATAGDLAQLIRIIRERVFNERGVKLEMEVEAWGMQPDELMPSPSFSAA